MPMPTLALGHYRRHKKMLGLWQGFPVIVAAPELPIAGWVRSPHQGMRPVLPTGLVQLPTLIVIHATDGVEGATKAESCAAMLARPDLRPARSAHYIVDSDSIVQCVTESLRAWHCGHTGNDRGIGIELCGRAGQTAEQWADPISAATLALAARLVRSICDRRGLPMVYVDAAGLRAGESGITTHAAVGEAWRQTSHRDPGPGFPLAAFVAAVRDATPSPAPLVT
jgi:N-acetyl-anhydromuramyl-L-alanine amidase AmpD